MMTIGELIERLQRFDADLLVALAGKNHVAVDDCACGIQEMSPCRA
ncbi:MAG: hypothetical protein HQL74_04805 [Magnetococcales bacterium]|nr:hypothetical protein [Magnetococcales bacterium]